MAQLRETVPFFFGTKDRFEDPEEFIENIECSVSSDGYATLAKVEQVTRALFRTHLKDKAWDWYIDLPSKVQSTEVHVF